MQNRARVLLSNHRRHIHSTDLIKLLNHISENKKIQPAFNQLFVEWKKFSLERDSLTIQLKESEKRTREELSFLVDLSLKASSYKYHLQSAKTEILRLKESLNLKDAIEWIIERDLLGSDWSEGSMDERMVKIYNHPTFHKAILKSIEKNKLIESEVAQAFKTLLHDISQSDQSVKYRYDVGVCGETLSRETVFAAMSLLEASLVRYTYYTRSDKMGSNPFDWCGFDVQLFRLQTVDSE